MNIARLILAAGLLLRSAATDEVDRLFGYGANYDQERQALDVVERALAGNTNDYQLLWRAARSYYYAGDGAPKDRIAFFERGIDAGMRAVARNPDGVEGHYWLGASYGGYCREKGGFTAFMNVKKVRIEMEIVLRLKETYEDASAYDALGEIDRQLPRMFGGNLKRSIDFLEKGLNMAPGNLQSRYALAEAYLQANRKNEARSQLEQTVQLPLTSSRTNENRRAQDKARKLLAKFDSK